MKRIQLLFLVVSLFGLGSCKDILEVIPENSVTFENAIRSEKDVESMVTSIRSMFRDNVSRVSHSEIYWRGLIADANTDYGDLEDAKHLGIYTNNPASSKMNWRRYYDVIASTNVVLDDAENAEGVPEDRMKFYKGQAYFYRAYTYFVVAQTWGDAPVMKNGRDVGEKAKSTWDEVVRQVMDDAQKAIDLLPVRDKLYDYAGNRLDRNDVPCHEAACMLKALACAWKASLNRDIYGKEEPELYEEAIRLATVVISSPSYKLAGSSEEVCTKVLMGGSSEGIFEVRYDISVMSPIESFTTYRHYITWPVREKHNMSVIGDEDNNRVKLKINYTTVDRMFAKGDQRRNAYFYNPDAIYTEYPASITGNFSYPYKYRKEAVTDAGYDAGEFININQDHVIYRLADVILLRAECYARLNQTGPAVADLKSVRDRAYGEAMPYPLDRVDDGGKDLRYHIYKERERELMWEDQRYFDMVRNGYYRTEMGTKEFEVLTNEEVKDGALYLPVGNAAFNDNRLMRQNRYWLRRTMDKN